MYVCMYVCGRIRLGSEPFLCLITRCAERVGVSIQFWRKFRGGLSNRAFWLFEERLGIVVRDLRCRDLIKGLQSFAFRSGICERIWGDRGLGFKAGIL